MVVPILIPVQSFPQYVKKVDVDTYLNNQAKRGKVGSIVVVVASIVLQAVMGFLVMPRMLGLYKTMNQTSPAHTQPLLLGSVILGLILLVVAAVSNPLDEGKVQKIKQSNEDLITINSHLMNSKLLWLFGGYALISVLALIVAIILPIYALTSSLETK